jgi:lysophospholipase L1-like esterase
MKISNILFVLYVIVATIAGLVLIDLISRQVNSANGVDIPLVIRTTHSDPIPKSDKLFILDPHLGFARSKTAPRVQRLQKKYSWIEGFAIYSKNPPAELDHPIILVMGGSTTDAVSDEQSWPEELAKLLARSRTSATVINGGNSGYSTNQELLKLVRDGLEFNPDIIISYSGVNDRGDYGKLPYPMVHSYQRHTLRFLTQSGYSPLFPNTVYLLNRILWGRRPAQTTTLGMPTARTLAQQYERNLILMEAIARASGATFYGIIQPNAYVDQTNLWHPKKAKAADYVSKLRDLYSQISQLPERLPFVHNFTSIFDGEEGVYADDGIHTTPKGDQIIAARVFDLIQANLGQVGDTGR